MKSDLPVYEVLPHNYDTIVEESKDTEKPWTREELEELFADAKARNTVAVVLIMDPKRVWGTGRIE
jgi:hypothetical protein